MTYEQLKTHFNLDEKYIDSFLEFLISKNKIMNLTSITNKEEMIEKHIFDSLLISKKINFDDKVVLDVGSGGGFPGIPLAIMFPKSKFILLDSTEKKVNYLNEAIEYLNLHNVEAKCGRVEKLNEVERYDMVISRAFADLPIYLELVTYLVKVGGTIIALKGPKAEEELSRSKNAMQKLNLKLIDKQIDELPISHDKRINLIFKKIDKTNKKYPREYSLIKNKSL